MKETRTELPAVNEDDCDLDSTREKKERGGKEREKGRRIQVHRAIQPVLLFTGCHGNRG